MKLTGKCKQDFEKWLFDYLKDPNSKSNITTKLQVISFENNHPSMQYGVYVDFFDSVGIVCDVQPTLSYDDEKYTEIIGFLINYVKLGEVTEFNTDILETRQEARQKVIEKANEIYNESK